MTGGKLYAGANEPYQIDTLNPLTGGATFVSNPSGTPAPQKFWGLAQTNLLSISRTTLAFPPQSVWTTSAAQNVTLINNGVEALAIKSIQPSGDFGETTTCGAILAPEASCTISVTSTPTQAGIRTGTLAIIQDVGGSLQTISLTSTGE